MDWYKNFSSFFFFLLILIFFSMKKRSILNVVGLISTKSTFPPISFAQFADATKLLGTVQRISFEVKFKPSMQYVKHSLHYCHAVAYFELNFFEKLFFKLFTSGP